MPRYVFEKHLDSRQRWCSCDYCVSLTRDSQFESLKKPQVFDYSNSTCNNQTGICECKGKYTGTKCFGCIEDHYGPNCNPCNCNSRGRKSKACNANGQCDCKTGFDPGNGRQCQHCLPGYYGPTCQGEWSNLKGKKVVHFFYAVCQLRSLISPWFSAIVAVVAVVVFVSDLESFFLSPQPPLHLL